MKVGKTTKVNSYTVCSPAVSSNFYNITYGKFMYIRKDFIYRMNHRRIISWILYNTGSKSAPSQTQMFEKMQTMGTGNQNKPHQICCVV